jgi:Raf kinase inhibitor-like YbhB/YbcL family protein
MKTMRLLFAMALVVMLVASVTVAQGPPPAGAGGQGAGAGAGGGRGGGGQGRGGRGGGGIPMPLVITTMAWTDGGDIPAKYAGAMGASPALSWTGAPMGTQSFLLIMHDMDVAPQRGADDVLHWIIWDIPGTATSLPEGLKPGDQADGSRIGRNIAGQNSYFGPAPPAGHPVHHYVLELYALDAKLGLPATATRADVMAALSGHVVARGAYYGKFKPS